MATLGVYQTRLFKIKEKSSLLAEAENLRIFCDPINAKLNAYVIEVNVARFHQGAT